MSAKTSVVLDDALAAEIRRLAGSWTSAAAVPHLLSEYIHLKETAPRRKEAERGGRKYMVLADLAELAQLMREGEWDDTLYRKTRGKAA